MKKIIILLFALALLTSVFADVITIGAGTSYTYEPIASYYGFHRSAAIYTAGQVGGSGTITTIAYKAYNTTATAIPIKVYMKMTTAASLAPAASWPTLITGLTPLYDGSFSGTTAGAWKTITLDTPFEYTGNNLEILIESNYGGGGTSGPQWYYSTAANQNQYIRADNTAPTTATGTVNSSRPDVQLDISGYTTFPPAFGVTPTSVAFGIVNMNTTTAYTNITVFNNVACTLNVTSAVLGGTDAARFILDMNSNPLPWALTAGQSKIVKVAFNPTAAATYSAYLRFGDDLRADHDVTLTGTGVDPAISTFPTVYDFGTSTSDAFPPFNWTKYNAVLADPTVLGTAGSGSWVQDDWKNVSSSTNKAARIELYSTNKGWLISPPINIPAAGYEVMFDVALMAWNNNNAPATTGTDDIFAVLIGDGTSWTPANVVRKWDNAGSPYVLNSIPPAGMTVSLPFGAAGTYRVAFYGISTLSNADNDLMVDNITFRQTPSNPIFTLSPNVASWDFGQNMVNTAATKQFTITNTGGGTLNIGSVIASGAYYSISVAPADVELTAGESTNFTVKYLPTMAGAAHTGTLTITDSRAVTTVALTGSCFDPTINTFPFVEGFETGNTDQAAAISQWIQATGPEYTDQYWMANSSMTTYNRTPRTGTWNSYLRYGGQSYMFRPIELTAGIAYNIELYARQDGAIDTNAKLQVKLGTEATIAGMTTSIIPETGLISNDYQRLYGTFSVPTTGTYFIGIQGWLNFSPWYISLDDITIDLAPTGPPEAVTLVSPADNATDLPKNGFNLTWSPVNTGGTPTSYTVYMASSVESIYEEEAFNGITGTSFNPVTDGGVTFNYEDRWFWTVEAVNGDGSAVVDPPFSFYIQADPSITSFPWNEGFETASFPPNGWSMLDADGDGENWFHYSADGSAHTGLYSAGSASWTSTAGSLTPNNWLITPPITIPATGEYLVEYYAAGQDPAYPDEHYGFYVSTTGTAPADFTLLFQETFEDAEWNYRMQNLSSYAGQTVYFAFRHFNSSDVFYMKIDDVAVREVPPVPTFSYSPAAWDFGTLQLLNPSTAKNFVLANTGAGNITINSGDIVLNDAEGNFVLTAANLPATLSGTTSYTFSVQFIPQSLGTKTATITIQDNLTRIIHTINLTGEAIAEPIVGIINLAGVAQFNNASLTWAGIYGSPGTPGYLHWDDTIMRGNVGAGANSYNVAVKFGTEAMAASAGMELTNVMIHLAEQPQTVDNLIIWTGTDAALTPVAIAYTQAVSGLVEGWNNITLTTPVAVTGTDAIYVGYHVNGIADTFPASTDGLTAVTNRGNLVDLGGWTTLTSSSIAGNWLIHAYFNAPSTMLSRRPVSVQSIPVVSQPLTQNDLRNLPIEARTTANADRALRGFNIYRDGLQINADIVAAYSYLDEGLAAGTYNYAVQSVHYSTNGVISGTVPVTILPPAPPIALPFTETWDIDFETNMWTAGSTNWAINTSNGAPAPSATFTWNPQVVDYSIALASYEFDATGVNSVQFSFDLALGNFSLDAENVMSWEIWDGTIWNTLGSYSSLDDDLGWTRFAYDVSTYASDRIFKIRFVASGEDSYEIDRWYIDNVHVAELPTTVDPVTDLGIAQTGTDLVLSWTAITGADWYYIYTSEDPYGTFNALGFVEGAGISLPTSMFPADKTFIKVTAGAGPFPRGERLDIAPAAKRK